MNKNFLAQFHSGKATNFQTENIHNYMEKKKRFGPVVVVAQSVFPIIWQSFIEAIVVFFTTIGLERLFKKKEEK